MKVELPQKYTEPEDSADISASRHC